MILDNLHFLFCALAMTHGVSVHNLNSKTSNSSTVFKK